MLPVDEEVVKFLRAVVNWHSYFVTLVLEDAENKKMTEVFMKYEVRYQGRLLHRTFTIRLIIRRFLV